MIGRVVIENYKSIESLSLDLGRVTVLIGANGSGKSNILEAIALCSAAAAGKLDSEFLFARGIRVSDDTKHMRSAFDMTKSLLPIKLSSEIRSSDSVRSFECEISESTIPEFGDWQNKSKSIIDAMEPLRGFANSKDSGEIILNVISFLVAIDKQSLEETVRNTGLPESMLNSMKESIEYEKSTIQEATKEGLISFLLYSPENSALRRFEDEGQIQPLGIRGEGLFKLLTVLARPENADRLAEIQERLQLLDWFGEFQVGGNIALGERNLRIRDQYLDGDLAYFTQRSANEGFLFLLFYFTLFVAKETPRFFAVDNIDASLNPKLCAELLRQLCELAAKYDKQVILTTHNPAILDGLNLRDENQRLYVVERDLEGRTQARRVEPRGDGENGDGRKVRLSEAFLRGYIGGLPLNF